MPPQAETELLVFLFCNPFSQFCSPFPVLGVSVDPYQLIAGKRSHLYLLPGTCISGELCRAEIIAPCFFYGNGIPYAVNTGNNGTVFDAF